MLIFPAIDLKDGKVVRLYKGDFATVHQVADDPAATARAISVVTMVFSATAFLGSLPVRSMAPSR